MLTGRRKVLNEPHRSHGKERAYRIAVSVELSLLRMDVHYKACLPFLLWCTDLIEFIYPNKLPDFALAFLVAR